MLRPVPRKMRNKMGTCCLLPHFCKAPKAVQIAIETGPIPNIAVPLNFTKTDCRFLDTFCSYKVRDGDKKAQHRLVFS